jgi:PAS domain S-box-containing protein
MPLDHPKVLAEAILHQNALGILLLNKTGQIIFVNEAASQLAWKNPAHTTFDRNPTAEIWGNAFSFDGKPISPEDWPILPALRGISTAGKELRLVRPDGSYRDLSVSAAPLRAEGGIIGAIASFIDLTEHRAAGKKLWALNTRLQELAADRASGIQLMHLISATAATNNRELFQTVLTEICTHLRWAAGYAYTLEAGRLHPIASYSAVNARLEPLKHATAAIESPGVTGFLGRVLNQERAMFLPDVTTEDAFVRKDIAAQCGLKSWLGIPVFVQKHPAAVLEFFHGDRIDAQDSVLEVMDAIAAYLGHVIERNRAEKKLQALFDSAPDAQIVANVAGQIVMANRQTERLFGYAYQTLIGLPVETLVPTELRDRHVQHRKDYAAAPHARPMGIGMELAALAADGTGIPVEVSLSPVELEEGLLIATAIRDVRERKQLQAELREKERLAEIGALAAIFVHEVANPLNGISCNAQMLKSSLPAEDRSLVDDLSAEIDRLESLLNQFRMLSSAEHLRVAPLDFTRVVERVVNMNAAHWSNLGIRLVTDYTHDLLIEGDAERLYQLILNLSKNAVESMEGGGTLTLRTYGTREDVALEITDSGVGIPDDIDVFNIFTTTKAKGSGIGLYIARQIVLAHHGTITYSTEPGRGTTFRVNLPKRSRAPRFTA